jgi:hypothetical protein
MTAEIAILNNSGIALAADSAVTIGAQKVYNSANKLFTLSKYQPVGIMVYDSADLMEVPWEIIVKEFRSKLGQTSYKTLKEYADKFWEFLKSNVNLIPQTNKENYVTMQICTYLNIIFKELEDDAKKELKDHGETSIEKSLSRFKEIIKKHSDLLLNTHYADNLNDDDAKALLDHRHDYFVELATRQLGRLYKDLDEDEQSELLKLVSNVFVRDRFILRRSGVVIAGYGTTEMFPKISSHMVEGIFNGNVRKLFQPGKSNVQNDVFVTTIVPFAQDEMVWTFLTGIDPEILKFSEKYLREIFMKYPEYIDKEKLGLDDKKHKELKDDLWRGGSQLFDDFGKALSKCQRESNTQPILDMVSVLPKDELAAMAESLVNLTVFKRKVSKSVETVGGPIDVAVISKGDGFVWVKRKHYFKPELNPHFFANYFREGK